MSKQFDRSKFRGTKIKSLKQQAEKEQSLSGKESKVHQLTDGKNYFRFYPPHPGGDLFLVATQVWFVPHYRDEDGQKVLGKKRIWNAKIHSKHNRDIVDEYIRLATREAASVYQDEKDLKEYLKHIHGYGRGSNYVGGLSGPIRVVGYAEKLTGGKQKQGVKLVELPMLVKNKLNELAIEGTDDDEVDPFSDPDNGLIIVITKDTKQSRPVDKYKVAYKMPVQKAVLPLSDSELNQFMNKPTLKSLFIDSYKLSDFQYAVEGLRIFDQKHGYGIFDMEEWNEIVTEMRALYPEVPDQEIDDEEDMNHVEDVDYTEDSDTDGFDREAMIAELRKLKVVELKRLLKSEDPTAKTYKSDTKASLIDTLVDFREDRWFDSQDSKNHDEEEIDDEEDDIDLDDALADDLPF